MTVEVAVCNAVASVPLFPPPGSAPESPSGTEGARVDQSQQDLASAVEAPLPPSLTLSSDGSPSRESFSAASGGSLSSSAGSNVRNGAGSSIEKLQMATSTSSWSKLSDVTPRADVRPAPSAAPREAPPLRTDL